MTDPAEEALRATDSGHSNQSSDPGLDRNELAAKLQNLAKELKESCRRLKRTWPDSGQDTASVWRAGLKDVQGYINRVDRMQLDCQYFVDQDSKASGKEHTAQSAITQLEQAVTDAIGATMAAIHSLELHDQPFIPETRSKNYIIAVSQLVELASRCSGLAVHMRGPEGLENQSTNQLPLTLCHWLQANAEPRAAPKRRAGGGLRRPVGLTCGTT